MKAVITTKYQCETCDGLYRSKEAALECEEKPISQDTGVRVGDIVIITGGEGSGEKAKVSSRSVIDKHWGHYAWKKYWHTISITAALLDSSGSRMLTFDNYKTV